MFQPAVDAEVATVLSQQLKVDLFVAELLVQRGLRPKWRQGAFFVQAWMSSTIHS